jgi:hypothetical protein
VVQRKQRQTRRRGGRRGEHENCRGIKRRECIREVKEQTTGKAAQFSTHCDHTHTHTHTDSLLQWHTVWTGVHTCTVRIPAAPHATLTSFMTSVPPCESLQQAVTTTLQIVTTKPFVTIPPSTLSPRHCAVDTQLRNAECVNSL